MKLKWILLTWWVWIGYSTSDVTKFLNKIQHPETAKVVLHAWPVYGAWQVDFAENWFVYYEQEKEQPQEIKTEK